MTAHKTSLIGSASGWGAQVRATENGPVYMKNKTLEKLLNNQGIYTNWTDMVHAEKTYTEISIPPGPQTLPLIEQQLTNLATAVHNAMQQNTFPCAIGGDHAMGIGTFSGAIEYLNAKQEFGLIWIDAHMDAHTPSTSPSQAFHGMPVATLMGYGEKKLTNLLSAGPKINPRDIVLIGIRSYEPEEKELLNTLGVKVFYCGEINKISFAQIIKQAILHVTQHTKAFGVSIDLDAFDPQFDPGVGSPEPNGLNPDHVLPYLYLLRENSKFQALEITELNPELDQDNKTANLLEKILIETLPR